MAAAPTRKAIFVLFAATNAKPCPLHVIFMNIPNRLREWLRIAFTEHVGLMNESYYFDRTANEFYSVFITDYFLTDPESNNDYPDSPYTPLAQ